MFLSYIKYGVMYSSYDSKTQTVLGQGDCSFGTNLFCKYQLTFLLYAYYDLSQYKNHNHPISCHKSQALIGLRQLGFYPRDLLLGRVDSEFNVFSSGSEFSLLPTLCSPKWKSHKYWPAEIFELACEDGARRNVCPAGQFAKSGPRNPSIEISELQIMIIVRS